jgi:hypothetical protein
MIDLLLKVLKSLKVVGQKESFLKFMGLLASGTFPLHNICYLLFLDIVEWFSGTFFYSTIIALVHVFFVLQLVDR